MQHQFLKMHSKLLQKKLQLQTVLIGVIVIELEIYFSDWKTVTRKFKDSKSGQVCARALPTLSHENIFLLWVHQKIWISSHHTITSMEKWNDRPTSPINMKNLHES